MRFFKFQDLLALLVFSILIVLPFHPSEHRVNSGYTFEVSMASSASGELRLYFDDGGGLREGLTAATNVAAGTELVNHRLWVPAATLRSIRLDPINAPAAITIENARIVTADGTIVRAFAPESFIPTFEIEAMTIRGTQLLVTITPGGIDPQLTLALDPPLTPLISITSPLGISVRRALFVFAGASILWFSLFYWPRTVRLGRILAEQAVARPGRGVTALALFAAVLSCYPVVFLGKSYVSPNYADGTVLLYPTFPTLPGYDDATTEHAKGSDVGAIAWSHGPISMLQHEALIEHGELPFWNRYNSAGTDLLGQGQLMFGDPLHFFVIAADGAAWAWDAKYVISKFLFAAALGFIVLALTGSAPAAWLTALSAPFLGFFVYRVNHPALFSFCYAPLILLAWVRAVGAPQLRAMAPWVLLLVLANVMEMNSGTAKEAYMLMLCMNFAGVLILGFSKLRIVERIQRLAVLAAAGVFFVLLTAPVWLTFLDALKASYTSYNAPSAFQVHPALLLGLFDELFYRPLHWENRVWNPSASFLVLLGVLYVAATWRRSASDRTKTALALACVPPFALAFGLVPPGWIVRVPFLGNVGHIDNTFSCALIILLIVIAGFGWKIARERLGTADGRGDLAVCGLLLGGLIIPWIAINQVIHRQPLGGTFMPIDHSGPWGPPEPFVWVSLLALVTASIVLAVTTRHALRRGSWSPAAIVTTLTCLGVLLWRFGAHAPTLADAYVTNPPVRVDFHARSEAIEFIRSDRPEPSRVAGLENVLMPGWSTAYRIEGISGPDALVNPAFRELISATGIERIWDWRLIVHPETLVSLQRVYDMFNVRYFLGTSRPAGVPESTFPTRLTADLTVMESPTAWPRAFFTDRVTTIDSAVEFIQLVKQGDGRPFAAALPAEYAALALPGVLADRTIVPADNYSLTPNTTTFEIDAPSRGVVVLNEAWQPRNFVVTDNGQPAKYLRINHAFKGVVIEQPGAHLIEFRFRPRHFTASALASLAGLAGLGCLWVGLRRPPVASA